MPKRINRGQRSIGNRSYADLHIYGKFHCHGHSTIFFVCKYVLSSYSNSLHFWPEHGFRNSSRMMQDNYKYPLLRYFQKRSFFFFWIWEGGAIGLHGIITIAIQQSEGNYVPCGASERRDISLSDNFSAKLETYLPSMQPLDRKGKKKKIPTAGVGERVSDQSLCLKTCSPTYPAWRRRLKIASQNPYYRYIFRYESCTPRVAAKDELLVGWRSDRLRLACILPLFFGRHVAWYYCKAGKRWADKNPNQWSNKLCEANDPAGLEITHPPTLNGSGVRCRANNDITLLGRIRLRFFVNKERKFVF